MAEPPSPGRSDWRLPKSQDAARSAGGKRGWQQHKAAVPAAAPAQSNRGVIVFGLCILLAGVLGLLAVWYFWPTPSPSAYWALLGAGYEEDLALPHNAHGMQGLRDLEHAEARNVKVGNVTPLKDAKAWAQAWDTIRSVRKSGSQRALVLFLALHGAADDEPYFLFEDHGKLSLNDLLKSLADVEASDASILLVIEPALASSYWPAGLLHNDFPEKLKAMEGEIKEKHPNLLILCACGKGQVSWASEEWRQTVFTHFLMERLQGAAGADENQRISVRELYEYVLSKVESWSRQNRGVTQTPMLLGATERADKIKLSTAPNLEPGSAGAVPPVSEDLRELWKQTARLRMRELGPFPAAYNPQLWRYYLDLGVRYEQLTRAGYDAKHLANLKERLDTAAKQLERGARCLEAVPSLGWTLPMPQVLGLGVPFVADPQLVLRLLDAPKQKDPPQVLRDIERQAAKSLDALGWKADATTITQTVIRGQLQRAVVNKYENEITSKDLEDSAFKKRIRDVIFLLDAGQDRSAQTHLLLMLLQHVDAGTDPLLLRQALRVRRLAEEAALATQMPLHPYAEVVFEWVHEDVAKADKLRRTGEDRLFVGIAQHPLAAADLGQAELGFKTAIERAATVRAALDLRDRALADLPYFAQWAASQRDPPPERGPKDLARLTSELSVSLKALVTQLQGPREIKQLDERTRAVQSAYTQLGQVLGQECDRLSKRLDQQERWHQTEAILGLPILVDVKGVANTVNLREGMLQSSRDMAHAWNQGEKPLDEIRDRTENRERQGRMVSAALEPYDVLPDRLVGSNLVLRETMDQMAKKLDSQLGDSDAVGAEKSLAKADLVCRGLLGAERVADRRDVATRRLRALRMSELLLWQADRTGLDHWFAEKGNVFLGKTYYQSAAKAYLRAAKDLVDKSVDDPKIKDTLTKRIGKKGGDFAKATALHVAAVPEKVFTGVSAPVMEWKLAKDDGAFQQRDFGVAVAWLGPLKGAKLASMQTGHAPKTDKGRVALEGLTAPHDENSATITCKLAYEVAAVDRPPVAGQLFAFYRGWTLEEPVELKSGRPDLIVRNDLPMEKPKVAVRMEPNAVCFVLDCSGSMLSKYKDKNRFRYAIDSLKAALANVPEGTPVSVLRFIMKKSDEPITKKSVSNYDYVRKPKPWDRDRDLDALIDQLRELEGQISEYSQSPIAKALREARDPGFASDEKRPKIIVCLTDGDDNWTAWEAERREWDADDKEKDVKNARWIKKYLEKGFDGKGVELRVVCFLDPSKAENADEALRAQQQFGVIRDFDPPGKFEPAADEKKLTAALTEAIRPKLTLYPAMKPSFDIPGRFPGEYLSPQPVDPGLYALGLPERLKHRLSTANGDTLVLKITRSGAHRVRRELVTDAIPRSERQVNRGRTIAIPRHNWEIKEKKLDQVITIENDPFADGDFIEQKRPHFLWIETTTKPADGEKPRQVRWSPVFNRTAPAYKVEVDPWLARKDDPAKGVDAQTKIWWSDDPLAVGESDTLPIRLGEPVSRFFNVGAAKVEIEEVAPYEDLDGGGEHRNCIVVRLSSVGDKKRRYRAKLISAAVDMEEEHRYFTDLGKVTAIFWPKRKLEDFTLQIFAIDTICERLAPVIFDLRSDSIRHKLLGE
jgi:von Willebrand factor type A domain